MGKSYMESVILDEVRKLSKVLGFESNKPKNSKLEEKRSVSLHQNGTSLSNMVRDSFSECQKTALEHNKVEEVNLSSNYLSSDETPTKTKKDRYKMIREFIEPSLIIFTIVNNKYVSFMFNKVQEDNIFYDTQNH